MRLRTDYRVVHNCDEKGTLLALLERASVTFLQCNDSWILMFGTVQPLYPRTFNQEFLRISNCM